MRYFQNCRTSEERQAVCESLGITFTQPAKPDAPPLTLDPLRVMAPVTSGAPVTIDDAEYWARLALRERPVTLISEALPVSLAQSSMPHFAPTILAINVDSSVPGDGEGDARLALMQRQLELK